MRRHRRRTGLLCAALVSVLVVAPQSGPASAQSAAARADAVNAQIAAFDWSGHYPFWFAEIAVGDAPGFAAVSMRVEVDGRTLRAKPEITLLYFGSTAQVLVDGFRMAPVATMSVDDIGAVSEVDALDLFSKAADGASLEAIRADPESFELRPMTAYGFRIDCVGVGDCVAAEVSIFALRDGEENLSERLDEAWSDIAFWAPTRAEAEALRASVVGLVEAMRQE